MTHLREFVRREASDTGLPLGTLIGAAVVIHVGVTLMAVNPWHPDEHFQILEFAWARAGLAPVEGLPWEFEARIRPTLQPTMAMGALIGLRALGLASPWAWMWVLRFATLALALMTMLAVVRSVSRSLSVHGRRALWISALGLWFAPLFLSRFSSENLAGIALAWAIVGLGSVAPAVTGALLGLTFVFRYPVAFGIVGLIGWIVAFGGAGPGRAEDAPPRLAERLRTLGHVAGGAAAVILLASLVDAWFYGAWTFAPWRYFEANLVQGVAASFGTEPWHYYLVRLPLWMAPPVGVAVAVLVVAGIARRPRSPWTWCLVALLAGHSLVAHKEIRFLLPALYLVPPLVAYGWEALAPRLSVGWRRGIAWGLGVPNVALALLLLTPSIHRGKEVDAHYMRFLYREAEAAAGQLVVLADDGRPYRAWELDIAVYAHPNVMGVDAGSPPGVVPREEVLLVTRGAARPSSDRGSGELVYEAVPGYRVMAGWVGLEEHPTVRWLEDVDGWTSSEWVRRVYRIKPSGPGR